MPPRLADSCVPNKPQAPRAELLWLSCCATALVLDAVAGGGGIASRHAGFALAAFAPLAVERLVDRAFSGPAVGYVAPMGWLISALALIAAAGSQAGQFAAWLALPAAAAMTRLGGLRPVAELLGLTAIGALTSLFLGMWRGPGLVDSFGSLGWTSSLGALAYLAVSAEGRLRQMGWRPHGAGRLGGEELSAAAVLAVSQSLFLLVDARDRITAAAGGGLSIYAGSARWEGRLGFLELFAQEDRSAARDALNEARGSGAAARFSARVSGLRSRLRVAPGSSGKMVVEISPAPPEIESALRERDLAQAGLRARTRFFASVSHELRTPLNAVMGFADLMRAQMFGPLSERYREYVELIYESAEHLLGVVGDILDAGKLEEGKYELELTDFDAAGTVRAAVRMLEPGAQRKGVLLAIEIDPPELAVRADPRALKQILLNLASNALKFTPAEGQVTISASRDADALILVCRDSGPGLTPEEIARLGRPFEQVGEGARRSEPGSGLGLSVVKQLCELHGGNLVAASVPGEGATFTVRLPGAFVDGRVPQPA